MFDIRLFFFHSSFFLSLSFVISPRIRIMRSFCYFFRLSFENLTPSFPSKFVFSRYVSSLFRRLLHPRTYVLDEGKYVRERILHCVMA